MVYKKWISKSVRFELNEDEIWSLFSLFAANIEFLDNFSEQFGKFNVINFIFGIFGNYIFKDVNLGFGKFDFLRFLKGFHHMWYLDFSEFFLIVDIKDVSQVHFKIVHVGTDSTLCKIGDFKVDDMFVYLFVGNLLVTVEIGEYFGDFSHFNRTQRFLKVGLFSWWVYPFESGLYFLYVGQACFVFVFGSETFVKFAFDALGFVINEGQNGAESFLVFRLQEPRLGNFLRLKWLNEFVTNLIKVGVFDSSCLISIDLLQNLFELSFGKVDSDIFEKFFQLRVGNDSDVIFVDLLPESVEFFVN